MEIVVQHKMLWVVSLIIMHILPTTIGCQRQTEISRKLEERLACVESALDDTIVANLMCVVNDTHDENNAHIRSQDILHLLEMIAILENRVTQLEHANHLPPYQGHDCNDVYAHGGKTNGRYLTSLGNHLSPTTFLCEMHSPSSQWTILQQRFTGETLFNRTWREYKSGFGHVSASTDFWIGLDVIHTITSQAPYILRVELMNSDNETRYAEYSEFSVAAEDDGYRLAISGYQGNAGDSLGPHNGSLFTTIDRDHDPRDGFNCAQTVGGGGGWWFGAGGCRKSNLNGEFKHPPFDEGGKSNFGIVWAGWENHVFRSFMNVSMKIQPVSG